MGACLVCSMTHPSILPFPNIFIKQDPALPIVYDEKCDPAYTADCRAKVVISGERLMDDTNLTRAHAEHRKIGALLRQTGGINETLIHEDAWDCLYDLIIGSNGNGNVTHDPNVGINIDYRIREGVNSRAHVVSTRHINKMIQQLTRLINKYSALDVETSIDWSTSEQAQFLVEILKEHRTDIREELDATDPEQVWPHPPKTNWVVFPKCGAESRRVWDYDYPHEYSGLVYDMFPADA